MGRRRLTKAELFAELAREAELPKRHVAALFDALTSVIRKELRACGEFVVPNLLKIETVQRPPSPPRDGTNPRTGERITIPAKPASRKIRTSALKGLRALVK